MHPELTDYTIVFDLDGTLVDTAPDLAAAANHVFEQIGLAPISPQALHPFISRGSRAMIEAGLRLHGVGKPEAEVTPAARAFFPYYAANVAALSRPFEGVPEMLDTLLKQRCAAGGVHQQVRGAVALAAGAARAG